MKQTSRRAPRQDASQDKRHQIMGAVLAQVPFDGWTTTAYEHAIRACGLTPEKAHRLFPQGIKGLIDLFGTVTDEAMQDRIKRNRSFAKLRVREKIAFAVRARLEFLTPHREAMRRLMFWYALPFHWAHGVKRLYRTVDLSWRAAGDTSTDFNFYTKRGLLAGVIKATMLFWLDDETPGCTASWEFLDRRINDVLRIGQAIGKLRAQA